MWFRRDLRLNDNAALYHALRSGHPVLPLFIFDRNILDDLEDKNDRRLTFIHEAVTGMQQQLMHMGASMEVRYGFPEKVFRELVAAYDVQSVFTNTDYEQYAIDRDETIAKQLQELGISFHSFKDQVIFEKDEVMKDDKTPYLVFTPYSKRWKATLSEFYIRPYPTEKYFDNFYRQAALPVISLEHMGFARVLESFPSPHVADVLIRHYDEQRNFPAVNGTSRLSVHLRFGTISIRALVAHVRNLNEVYLNELIWRDFYHMITWNLPQVRRGEACKKEYDRIQWRNNEFEFKAWCEGMTGYPIVDAGMRELNATGYMHNRVRMITASFLCKHLLIDWRWGEHYFARKLLDYDFAANNGGWQWTAGSGCDGAPYFRIFNPAAQTARFDPHLEYIRKWVPEVDTFEYPRPIVNHEIARDRCLKAYQEALKR